MRVETVGLFFTDDMPGDQNNPSIEQTLNK